MLYTTEASCKQVGGTWGYYGNNAYTEYVTKDHWTDEQTKDFYYTGVHRMKFDTGLPSDFNYKGEHQQGTWYSKGDVVFYKPQVQGGLHPETEIYYCVADTNSTPGSSSPNWERQKLNSFLFGGVDSSLDPDAYHSYNEIDKGFTHRYEEGKNATANLASMGETYVRNGPNDFEIWYNQENNPNQFYIADIGHFNMYETCHGTRPAFYQGFSGDFNFYNASYPAGYYAPPYGEVPTLTLVGSSSADTTINSLTATDFTLQNFMAGDCCPELDIAGEMTMWGIRTVFPKKTPMVTYDEKRGDEHGIHAPYEECPPDFPPQVYFDRELFGFHPGSIMAPGAGTFYNDNPFPNSLDIDGWFNPHVYEGQTCYAGGERYWGYKLKAGFPELAYPVIGAKENKLDAGICKAREAETSQLLGFNFEGVQGGMGTGPGAATNDQASFATYDPFIYWHFIFRYNHESLWNETENTLTNKVVSFTDAEEYLAEQHMWEYRQCPNTPDFLPYSADTPIHACPSHYFDIPYYAAIGKFGFYGARFFNTCSVPNSIKGTETQEGNEQEFNYYSAAKCGFKGGGAGNPLTFKALKKVSETNVDTVLRVNGGCYEVKYTHTSTDDEPTDMVISQSSPGFEDETHTIELTYTKYKHATAAGFNLGHVTMDGEVNVGSLSFTVPACQNCIDGGSNLVNQARDNLKEKWEGVFNVDWATIQTMLSKYTQGQMNVVGMINDTNLCSQPACAPFYIHGSVAHNPADIVNTFNALDNIIKSHSLNYGIDNIHGNGGEYTTFQSKVDLVRDYSAGVQDCLEYEEPPVIPGTCNNKHYDVLLEIAANEQRLNEFFVGNHGFFLWANYHHITADTDYLKFLVGPTENHEAEIHFKTCLYRLKQDFDQILLSLPNFFSGNDDPVIYYEKASDGLYGNQALDYSRQGLFNDMLFSNNRYRRFLRELEWDEATNLFVYTADKNPTQTPIAAWNRILKKYSTHIASFGGGVEASWYKKSIEAREKRILTRYVENKLRGKSIDLYPTNQISFSVDNPSPYITGRHWGNSKWGDSVVGNHQGANFDPLPGEPDWLPTKPEDKNPGVMRRYFHGNYAARSSATGHYEDIANARGAAGEENYYAGLFQDFNCGGDQPRGVYTAGGLAVSYENKGIPSKPWITQGHNDIGKVNQGFSCFSPIFIQQPMNTVCKIGQRPTFRAQAVDYHTIPEDKVNKGYPEIDYWTNSLKLTNANGELKYPIKYQWYRMLKKPAFTEFEGKEAIPKGGSNFKWDEMEQTFDEWFYANEPILQKASITGEWACLEGVSGVGAEDCTMFHPQVSYTHKMLETYEDKDEAGRKYRHEHWGQMVDGQGKVWYVDSSKNVGTFYLWKKWAYLQGAITKLGKKELEEGRGEAICKDNFGKIIECADEDEAKAAAGQEFLSSVPCFDKNAEGAAYTNMLENEYGLRNENGDEEYVYFCVASGRFGFRRSEYVNLDIEDFISMDVSVRNGAPVTVPLGGISYDYTRIDQPHNVFNGGIPSNFGGLNFEVPQEALDKTCPQSDENFVQPFNSVTLIPSFSASTDDSIRAWTQPAAGATHVNVGPFFGTNRDVNAVYENEVLETMNMSNNCRSFAFVGKEGFRGVTRTYRAPTQHNHQGTSALRAGWFEYGLLFPFGNALSQAWGNALYSQPQIPVCRDYFMPKGCTAQGFKTSIDVKNFEAIDPIEYLDYDHCGKVITRTRKTNLEGEISTDAGGMRRFTVLEHYTKDDRAVMVNDKRAGVPTNRIEHHGKLYPWNEMSPYYGYDTRGPAHHGRGASWQFDNNMGVIKRFGMCTPFPKGNKFQNNPGAVAKKLGVPEIEEFPGENRDVYFWIHPNDVGASKKQFYFAKRFLIRNDTLAGVNCGWRTHGCGRYMLYFVEALHRYYISCSANGKKRTINLSFIAPGLRQGAAGINYFAGGYPNSTYVKRNSLLGPYAYDWKVSPHNRDRHGNGIPENFVSTKFNRPMYMYDPPAVYGLWAKQTSDDKEYPKTERLRNLRRAAQKTSCPKGLDDHCLGETYHPNGGRPIPYDFMGVRFGPYGTSKNGGCGTMRLGCVDAPHTNRTQWYRPGNEQCDWYKYAEKFGLDHGSNYGCNEKQLIQGTCFDPCLSLKYNYGFFPGGKLLTINNYVKYRESRHDAEDEGQAGQKAGVLGGQPVEADLRRHPEVLPSLTTLQADGGAAKTPAGENRVGAQKPPPPKKNTSRFLTQLTGDVGDEERAITKNKKTKFVRIMRGPWATPYRRIRAAIIEFTDPGSNVQRKVTSSDEFNKMGRLGYAFFNRGGAGIGMEMPLMGEKYNNIQNRQPTDKFVTEHFTDTTVSPCNPYGADHCNYVTHTFHLEMDTQIKYFDSSWSDITQRLGGGYKPTDDITVGTAVNNMMQPLLSWVVGAAGMLGWNITCVFPLNPACAASLLITLAGIGFGKVFDHYKNAACNGDLDPGFWDCIYGAITSTAPSIDTSQLGQVIAQRARTSAAGQVQNALLRNLDSLHQAGRLIRI